MVFSRNSHDVWNYDLAAPPILTMIKRNGKNVDAVVGPKLGNVIILDRESVTRFMILIIGSLLHLIYLEKERSRSNRHEITGKYAGGI